MRVVKYGFEAVGAVVCEPNHQQPIHPEGMPIALPPEGVEISANGRSFGILKEHSRGLTAWDDKIETSVRLTNCVIEPGTAWTDCKGVTKNVTGTTDVVGSEIAATLSKRNLE
jgi:hypothetical protein